MVLSLRLLFATCTRSGIKGDGINMHPDHHSDGFATLSRDEMSWAHHLHFGWAQPGSCVHNVRCPYSLQHTQIVLPARSTLGAITPNIFRVRQNRQNPPQSVNSKVQTLSLSAYRMHMWQRNTPVSQGLVVITLLNDAQLDPKNPNDLSFGRAPNTVTSIFTGHAGEIGWIVTTTVIHMHMSRCKIGCV